MTPAISGSTSIASQASVRLVIAGRRQIIAIEFVSVKITPGSGGPARHDNVVATDIGTIKIREGDQHGVVYVRVAYITGPLIWAEVDAENVSAPIPASVMESSVAAVADRAAQA